ncbi:MAG: heavy metal translocating P-type ATPase [Clostridia bacterium]|nr:heavy metal translocating P-type ATPase [Clostridia bacterium]
MHDHEHNHAHDTASHCSCGCHEHKETTDCGCHEHEHKDGGCSCGCGCGCHHHHSPTQTKTTVLRIITAAALLLCATIADRTLDLPLWGSLLLYLPAYLVAGYDVLLDSGENILHGEIFDENFLMCIATLGALVIGFIPGAEAQFAEAVFVMIFFKTGELFEEIAEGRSRKAISSLMDIRPDIAFVERDGEVLAVDPDTVKVGELIVVRPGERIPMDGTVIEGASALDTVALTGESEPRDIGIDDAVLSGCVNLSGVLRVRVTKHFGESTATKILELVENAGENKSKSESFIRRFAKWYTPAVVFAAIALAVLPPLIMGDFRALFATWFARGLTFLVVSCPCALVISVPLTFFGGIGGASRNGILIKGGNYIETLARVDTVVLDKTGTLTKGAFAVTAVHAEDGDEKALIYLAAHVEHFSTHPIAASLRSYYGLPTVAGAVSDVSESAGHGISATVEGKRVSVGNERMMAQLGIMPPSADGARGTLIYVAIDGMYAGYIVISDIIKPTSDAALRGLEQLGVSRTVMLTGDRKAVAASVATDLAIKEYHAELLPADKVDRVEKLLTEKHRGGKLAFVGDGINDAPVLARADVGIAMGAMGSDAAVEAADVVLMDDDPSKIARAISIARRTLAIAKQNIVFAIGIKLAVLLLTALGATPMWLAVFADVGVMVIAVLNAMRAIKA